MKRLKPGSAIVSAPSSGGSYSKAMGQEAGNDGLPGGYYWYYYYKNRCVFIGGEGEQSQPSVLLFFKKKKITHLTFVRSHFGKQGLRHLGSFHLLLDLIINSSCDVDAGAVHLNREVCCRCRGFGLPRDHANSNLKSAAFRATICAEIIRGLQSADAKPH